jgi:hypothetical protein
MIKIANLILFLFFPLASLTFGEVSILRGVFYEEENLSSLKKASRVFEDAFNSQSFNEIYNESMSTQFRSIIESEAYEILLSIDLPKENEETIKLDRAEIYYIAENNWVTCVGLTYYVTKIKSGFPYSEGNSHMHLVLWEFEKENGWRALNLPFLRFLFLEQEASKNHLLAFLKLAERLANRDAGFMFDTSTISGKEEEIQGDGIKNIPGREP